MLANMASHTSRMYPKCTVCNTRRVPGLDTFLAALPLDPARCCLWVQAIGQEDLVHLPIEKLHTLKYVCGIHFAHDDFNKQRNRLLLRAVPKYHLPLPPLPAELFVDFPLHIGWDKAKQQPVTLSVPLHRFPQPEKNPDLFRAWVSAIGDKLKESDSKKIYSSKKVCDHHFDPMDKMTHKNLKKGAVPSLNLKRLQQCCTTYVDADHCYTRRIYHSRNYCTHNVAIPSLNIVETPNHRFPNPDKFPEQFKAWVAQVAGKLDSASDYDYYKKKIVCNKHFRKSDKNRYNRVNKLAIPSILCGFTTLHGFPDPENDRKRFNAWLMAVGGDILALDNNHIHKYRRVCHSHFEANYRCRNHRISKVVVPTLNLATIKSCLLHAPCC